ncbi:MAG: hypothetical protein ABIP75_20130 [Pyrinomonadaceae bacterium]
MYDFITWVIEYSEDDPLAGVLFVALLPFLLLVKLVLRFSELIGGLRRRRYAITLVPIPPNGGDRLNV